MSLWVNWVSFEILTVFTHASQLTVSTSWSWLGSLMSRVSCLKTSLALEKWVVWLHSIYHILWKNSWGIWYQLSKPRYAMCFTPLYVQSFTKTTIIPPLPFYVSFCSVFVYHLLNPGWPCDLLWKIKCVKGTSINFGAQASRGLAVSNFICLESCVTMWGNCTACWRMERLRGTETNHRSWGLLGETAPKSSCQMNASAQPTPGRTAENHPVEPRPNCWPTPLK